MTPKMNANTPEKNAYKAGDVWLYIVKNIAAINCAMRPVSFTYELLEMTVRKNEGCTEEIEPFENVFVNSGRMQMGFDAVRGMLGNFILPHGMQTWCQTW
jgi:hypothetical protein